MHGQHYSKTLMASDCLSLCGPSSFFGSSASSGPHTLLTSNAQPSGTLLTDAGEQSGSDLESACENIDASIAANKVCRSRGNIIFSNGGASLAKQAGRVLLIQQNPGKLMLMNRL